MDQRMKMNKNYLDLARKLKKKNGEYESGGDSNRNSCRVLHRCANNNKKKPRRYIKV